MQNDYFYYLFFWWAWAHGRMDIHTFNQHPKEIGERKVM